LIFDSAGNLYGTNEAGGLYNYGTVFELSPSSGGGWTISVLYNFFGKGDGAYPVGGVVRDTAGNVYGTTFLGGGPNNSGIVFKLALVGAACGKKVSCTVSEERPTVMERVLTRRYSLTQTSFSEQRQLAAMPRVTTALVAGQYLQFAREI
jgi:uncharacterized repeat protein (TIGR03803 family)